MSDEIRSDQKVRYYLLKILPKPIIQLVVTLKGTGVLDAPKKITPQNNTSLECTIASNKYGVFCTPDSCQNDTPVQAIYRGEQYEEETLLYIKSLELEGDIIHAGTYFGDSLPLLSKSITDKYTVWAFEPNMESFRCAEVTILLNQLQNVTLFEYGLGNEQGTGALKIKGADDFLGGTAQIQSSADNNTVEVKMTTLDKIILPERKIALIHLDIEGYEIQALSGAKRIIEENQPIIIVELNNKDTILYLESIGYTMTQGLEKCQWRHGYRNGVFRKK